MLTKVIYMCCAVFVLWAVFSLFIGKEKRRWNIIFGTAMPVLTMMVVTVLISIMNGYSLWRTLAYIGCPTLAITGILAGAMLLIGSGSKRRLFLALLPFAILLAALLVSKAMMEAAQ